MNKSLASGEVRAFCLGMGVDPLTYATDLLTAVVIEAPVFDELFGTVAATNEEGRVLDAKPFDEQLVMKIVQHERLQAAGAATLALAVEARTHLL
ncbi:hypothetical protein MOQ72_29245 [Saccharopolyspora sp. K220]|uniref:hypothetical protein n=1 Tax=Saccharopolyspora soli TaxID=2926618 RepID=UPI001F5A0B84|nr:hypothetical protein [Saccharopolyspora soli]MCI2421528.1 hypothetical protein [Saccharopolyspora soli]